MAFQIRRAHRFLSSPQDLIALRISNRTSSGKVPGTLPMSVLLGIALTFLLSACIHVRVSLDRNREQAASDAHQSGQPENSQTEEIVGPVIIQSPASTGGQCNLESQINSATQETGSWCWAASSQLVVEYLTQIAAPQCELVSQFFEDRLRGRTSQPTGVFLDCCEYLKGNPDARNLVDICEQGGWPEWILDKWTKDSKRITFQKNDWSSGQVLDWKGLTDQICLDRPFIFVVRWSRGGRHTAVGGGYHTSQNYGNFVEVYDHSPDGFYVMPFQEFQGGRRFTHEYDYVDIQVQ